jgi:hypothetical protein
MHLALWNRRFGSQVMYLGGMDIYIYSSCSSVQTAIKALCIQQKLPSSNIQVPFYVLFSIHMKDLRGRMERWTFIVLRLGLEGLAMLIQKV